jgi:hypothetical protein
MNPTLVKLTVCLVVFALLYFMNFSIATGTLALGQDNPISNSTSTLSQASLKVLLTIFGIDNSTGDILGFITVNNHTDYRIVRSTDLNKVATGIGQFEIESNGGRVKIGDQYNVCIVLLKNMHRDCIISYKLPTLKVEQVGFSVKL